MDNDKKVKRKDWANIVGRLTVIDDILEQLQEWRDLPQDFKDKLRVAQRELDIPANEAFERSLGKKEHREFYGNG